MYERKGKTICSEGYSDYFYELSWLFRPSIIKYDSVKSRKKYDTRTIKIKVGKSYIYAFFMRMQSKPLIVLRGNRGYIMCGYLNLKTAEKLNDVAAVITGVSTISQALKANVISCTMAAEKIGIYNGQSVKEVLKIIV